MRLRLLIDVEVSDAMVGHLAAELENPPVVRLAIQSNTTIAGTEPLVGRLMGAQQVHV